jgi:hypothetical protein
VHVDDPRCTANGHYSLVPQRFCTYRVSTGVRRSDTICSVWRHDFDDLIRLS